MTTRGYAGRASRLVAPPWFQTTPLLAAAGRERRSRTVGPEHHVRPASLGGPYRGRRGRVSVDDLQSYSGTLGPQSEGARPCFPESGQRPRQGGDQDGASCHTHNLTVVPAPSGVITHAPRPSRVVPGSAGPRHVGKRASPGLSRGAVCVCSRPSRGMSHCPPACRGDGALQPRREQPEVAATLGLGRRKPAHWTRVDRDYLQIRIDMQTLLTDLAIEHR